MEIERKKYIDIGEDIKKEIHRYRNRERNTQIYVEIQRKKCIDIDGDIEKERNRKHG